MIKIVVDAFGGDYAPVEVVKGAVDAINRNNDIHVVLSGNADILENELKKYKYEGHQISIINATEVIGNNESPTVAIRQKKNSSLVVALDYAKSQNDCVGIVSSGSTGALLTGGVMMLGRLKGIHRPALCPVLPTIKGSGVTICDCGANMDSKPEYLEQFAIMARSYMIVVGYENPRVALLNVGTEDHKGDTTTKQAFDLLVARKDQLNFVGNMEARDLLSGDYDVVVADGFAGNVLLKSTEGAIKGLLSVLKREIKAGFFSKIGAIFMRKAFKGIKKSFDYNKHGGAVLLGCKKLVVKAHGSSKAESIRICIEQVATMAKGNLIEKISSSIGGVGNANE